MLWTRLAPEPADPTALGTAKIPVGWRVARDDAHATGRGAGHGVGNTGAGPLRARRGQGSALGRRLLLPVRHRRRGKHGRPLPHRAGARRLGGPTHVRRRHLPGRPERLLHGVPGHGPERPRPRPPPRRLHVRVRLRRVEPERSRGSAPFNEESDRPAHVPAPPHAAQARPGPAGRPRRLPVRRGVGRPRGAERLLGAGARVGIAVAGVHRPTGGRVPGVLRAPADPPVACRSTQRTNCGSTAA